MTSESAARVTRKARRASDSPAAHFLARAGLTARGVIYILVGVVAVLVALGQSSREADQSGALQLLAGGGVLSGNQAARWFAVAVLGLSAIDQMFFIPAYPFWSLLIIAIDVVALDGLCAYGSRENLAV